MKYHYEALKSTLMRSTLTLLVDQAARLCRGADVGARDAPRRLAGSAVADHVTGKSSAFTLEAWAS